MDIWQLKKKKKLIKLKKNSYLFKITLEGIVNFYKLGTYFAEGMRAIIIGTLNNFQLMIGPANESDIVTKIQSGTFG